MKRSRPTERFTLEALLAGVTDANRHGEMLSGRPVGLGGSRGAAALPNAESEVSTTAAAKRLGVSRLHICKLFDAGLLEERMVGSKRRIYRDSLDAITGNRSAAMRS